MPNGKIHDHPFSDILIWNLHPFPKDIEELFLACYRLDRSVIDEFSMQAFDWEAGIRLDEARQLLSAKLKELKTRHRQD